VAEDNPLQAGVGEGFSVFGSLFASPTRVLFGLVVSAEL
jgi:hypothetical protein